MGSYYIPSNQLKGESRILYIFTTKALIYTAIGGLIGGIFYLVFNALGMKLVGVIIMAVLAVAGYGLAMLKMPTVGTSKLVKNVGGDSIDEIIKNYAIYKKNKKVYSYAVPRKEPTYSTDSLGIEKALDGIRGTSTSDTKEEK